MRSEEEVRLVQRLAAAGRSSSEISRITGVPRSTVRRWRATPRARPGPDLDWRPPDQASYSYLLGIYLGDGCLSVPSERSGALTVTLDSRYPGVVDEVAASMAHVFPGTPIGRYPKGTRAAVVLQVCSLHLRCAFPQHGPGRKHTRPIALCEWRLAEYSYVRYFFTNLSDDIRAIFCEHCERIGARWTQSNAKSISIADRESVELFDSFVGPKR